jgi:antitoxin (DNA-binding transcriptional repressor) of toxin-antitoxin stability system
MTVTAEYAQAHIDQLLAAVEQGEEVRIDRGDKPAVRLTLDPVASEAKAPVAIRPRSELIGSMAGKIFYNDDWDSEAESQEMADLFENSVLFPTGTEL